MDSRLATPILLDNMQTNLSPANALTHLTAEESVSSLLANEKHTRINRYVYNRMQLLRILKYMQIILCSIVENVHYGIRYVFFGYVNT